MLSLHVSLGCAADTNEIVSFNLLTITVKQDVAFRALPEWQIQLHPLGRKLEILVFDWQRK